MPHRIRGRRMRGQYRRPRFRRRRYGRTVNPNVVIGGAVFAVAVAAVTGGHAAVAAAGHHAPARVVHAQAADVTSTAAVKAIAYAKDQLGRPYVWGGVGPAGDPVTGNPPSDGYDCSGLVMEAYLAAGVTLARVAKDQWATERRIPASQLEPGDLVFFAGSDGTTAEPGHVGLIIDPARHLMINAYMTGMPVLYATYGLPGSMGGLTDPVGYTDPTAARNS